MKKYDLLINNTWEAPSTNEYFESICPANGKKLAEFAAASMQDVDKACKAARKAYQDTWRFMDATKRMEHIQRLADVIARRKDEFARAEALDTGKPISETIGFDIPFSIYAFEYFARLALDEVYSGDVIPVRNGIRRGLFDFTVLEPYGVVAVIAPYNYPLHLLTRSLAPALAAGNTVICKASSMTPWTTAMLGEAIIEADFPVGVINIISGSGSKVGKALALNEEVDVIAFTGSEKVGRDLMRLSSESVRLKKTILELGGKGPIIVEDDCDLSDAARTVLLGLCANQGQVCCATTRLYLNNRIYDDFLKELTRQLDELVIGDIENENVTYGSLISIDHLNDVARIIREAVEQGATVFYGGERIMTPDTVNGAYYKPTILTNVNHDFACVKDEIFGPVVSVMKYDSFDEAIQLANDTLFGLGANIFTDDFRKAYRFSQEVDAGSIWVNMPNGSQMNCPFGGNRNSGMGREYGIPGLHEYLKVKNNMWNMKQGPFSYY